MKWIKRKTSRSSNTLPHQMVSLSAILTPLQTTLQPRTPQIILAICKWTHLTLKRSRKSPIWCVTWTKRFKTQARSQINPPKITLNRLKWNMKKVCTKMLHRHRERMPARPIYHKVKAPATFRSNTTSQSSIIEIRTIPRRQMKEKTADQICPYLQRQLHLWMKIFHISRDSSSEITLIAR